MCTCVTDDKWDMDAIEIIFSIVQYSEDDTCICCYGLILVDRILSGDAELQNEFCENGGIRELIRILTNFKYILDVSEKCSEVIAKAISSPEVYAKYYTRDILKAVDESCEVHSGSVVLRQALNSILRKEDPRVRDAVSRGVCTKEAFPECNEDCRCDENVYCPNCCVQQKAFRCLTCDKDETRLYCETCWKRDHQGHKGEEFFCPVICATGNK